MSTEQHIDPEVTYIARCPEHGLHGERTECFVCKGPVEQVPMVELAQADPEGQEYVYRTCWMDDEEPSGEGCLIAESEFYAEDMRATQVRLAEGDENAVWVERALLGTWERVEK